MQTSIWRVQSEIEKKTLYEMKEMVFKMRHRFVQIGIAQLNYFWNIG